MLRKCWLDVSPIPIAYNNCCVYTVKDSTWSQSVGSHQEEVLAVKYTEDSGSDAALHCRGNRGQ